MRTSLISDEKFLLHKPGDCPESPERYAAILAALKNDDALWNSLTKVSPRQAGIADVLRCHDEDLIRKIKTLCAKGGGQIDEDTIVSADSFDIALLSAGAALVAVDEVLTEQTKNAFALARPPGHHATRSQSMGFCIFNNAAIAARYAQAKYQLEKILIIDWDVHHGNGTQDIFYRDPSVFYFSIHEAPFYPGTGAFTDVGEGPGRGTTLNIPLPAMTPAKLHREAFSASLQTIRNIFLPDLIIISAGFDARAGDPIGEMMLTGKDFFEMTGEVMEMAEQCCDGKLISVLEGGYLNETLGETVRQHLVALSA